ncbi:hypothetical protein IP88_04110 [alpha proteobacterium AAP81b]|nr:hypothetical protein IP88_04110 [alpha proteobacterium AAP81b]
MNDRDRLFQATAAEGQGASFVATREGGFAMLTPLTAAAEAWLRANTAEESTWIGDTLVIEMRYFGHLAEAIIAAGFLFERNALPN